MNIVLTNATSTLYYLVGIWKIQDEYTVETKWLRIVGKTILHSSNAVEKFKTFKEARSRCRVLAKNKISKKHMVLVGETAISPSIMTHFAPPIGSQMTPEEFLWFVTRVRTERYVTFKDNHGMENFDIGIQYVGYVVDEPDMMEVYDKNGDLRHILVSKLDTIVKTEDSLKAEALGMQKKL